MVTKLILAGLILAVGAHTYAPPLWADSKTHEVKVSCTIAPKIEMSVGSPASSELEVDAQAAQVQVLSNLPDQYTLKQTRRKEGDRFLLTYSVTAR